MRRQWKRGRRQRARQRSRNIRRRGGRTGKGKIQGTRVGRLNTFILSPLSRSEKRRGDRRPASTCTDLSFYASLSSVLRVVYYKSMCVHCSGSLLQLIHECKLIDCYLDFYTSIKCCYCLRRVLSFDVLDQNMLEWKCCFRTRVVRRLNDSSTVIVCLCILFLRDHLESLVLMWLCLKEIPNDSFAGLTNRSSLQRSQSGWWWHSWGVWLFAVLCSYMRLSYWRRRFSTVDLQHNDHRALHSLDFYMIFCNDVLFSF